MPLEFRFFAYCLWYGRFKIFPIQNQKMPKSSTLKENSGGLSFSFWYCYTLLGASRLGMLGATLTALLNKTFLDFAYWSQASYVYKSKNWKLTYPYIFTKNKINVWSIFWVQENWWQADWPQSEKDIGSARN